MRSSVPGLLPWSVAVPVRTSGFTPHRPESACFNIEVALDRIKPFAWSSEPFPGATLSCDLQTNADYNSGRRLGSGRSGFFRGHYLKGVGRTSLAGNWNASRGLSHSNGVLLPSAAARELLVSSFLAKLGRSDLAVNCKDILLRDVPRASRGYDQDLVRAEFKRPARINERTQAISVKEGGFCRFSNFLWWISNFPQIVSEESPVATFFLLMDEALVGMGAGVLRTRVDAASIAKRLANTVNATIIRLMDTWALGIAWGSMHNNFSIDGRFLDLETPMVHPGPLFGARVLCFDAPEFMPETVAAGPQHRLYGIEVDDYVAQVRAFIRRLKVAFECMPDLRLMGSMEKRFVATFFEALREYTRPPHLLNSRSALTEFVVSYIGQALSLTRLELRQTRLLYTQSWSPLPFKRGSQGKSHQLPILRRMSSFPTADPEPPVVSVVYVPDFIQERCSVGRELNRIYNECVFEADNSRDAASLNSALGVGMLRIKQGGKSTRTSKGL